MLARPPIIPEDEVPEFKEPIPRLSGKEGSKEIPSWARGLRPKAGENIPGFVKRLLDEKYGPGNWKKGADSEYSKIKKNLERSYRTNPLAAPDDNSDGGA